MNTRTRTFADVGVIALTASVLFAGVLTTSAQAAPVGAVPASQSPVIDYVALGDSYAAGQGAGFYDNACLQSELSYPESLDDLKHVKLIADTSCTGAPTEDVLTRQLSAIKKNKSIELVTLSTGANDLGGPAVLAACSVDFASVACQTALNAALALLSPPPWEGTSPFAAELGTTLTAVAAAAPDATILVTGYPHLFETPPMTDPSYELVATINGATDLLNATIASVVTQTAAGTGADIRYVDVTAAFAGHGIGSPDPWINLPDAGPVDAFHPTAVGYRAYSLALQAHLPVG